MDELLTNVVTNAPAVAALLYLVYRQQKLMELQQKRLYDVLEALLQGDIPAVKDIINNDH